jgi:cellulose biosynthesis protein BcsQ
MRGLKVVAVDLDLEAPGLSTAFDLKPQPKYGIVDYFYERSYLPEGVERSISIAEIIGEVRVPNATGRLFVVPAGFLNLDYVSKVDDLHATTIIDGNKSLWSVFKEEIQEQLKPDILLVDSRTGINQWGALSLIKAADEAIIFLFPNEQNKQGIELLLKSLKDIKNISINFVFSPVPDVTKTGLSKVKNIWDSLQKKIKTATNENYEAEADEDESDIYNDQTAPIEDFLVVPYLVPIALADSYPVQVTQDYYTKIANLIDETTDQLKRSTVLSNIAQRWKIIENLRFPEVNAAEQGQDLSLVFQRTTDFERFLDDTTCLIRGRKGTGKTALYWLFLQHKNAAQKLAHGRLDNTVFLSAHGRFQESRPSRDEFQDIHKTLQQDGGTWEAFWRAYLLLRCYQQDLFKFPQGKKGAKFSELKTTINNVPRERWQSESTQALLQLSTNSKLRPIVKDAVSILLNDETRNKSQKLWFLYDDLDEDFSEAGEVRQQALTGLFQLVQSCEANRLTEIRFKIFLREDIWNRLSFDNKSHFTGRYIILQWTRIDFLRLALRQAIQSDFKNLVDRISPVAVESIDQANEDAIDKALEILWGSRRRGGNKSKKVSRWVYERLTDSSGTTFPRSLSILLTEAKEQELTYKGQSSSKFRADRLLQGTSLEFGLKKASEKRCEEIKEEYPNLINFFELLNGKSALLEKEQLQEIWQKSAVSIIENFEEFASFLGEIGIIEWREKDKRYKFADIYVYGFKMDRRGTV